MVLFEQERMTCCGPSMGLVQLTVFIRKGGGGMKGAVAILKILSAVCVVLLVQGPHVLAQDGASNQPTKTIVGDLLDIDRDLYIVRGERGEMHVEATYQTEVTEAFEYGDRIKALVLMNNKALKIERAGPDDVPGVVENKAATAKAPVTQNAEKDKAEASVPPPPAQQPDRKTIVGDLLDIDRDLYIVRGERGEIHVEATYQTEVTEAFEYGDRIKALVLMNNKALKIERAGPDDVSGVVLHEATSFPSADQIPVQAAGKPAADGEGGVQAAASSAVAQGDDIRVVEGQVLMVDGDFYVIRGEHGEIRVERTLKTKMTEEFRFGDFIKATVTPTDRALVIQRLQ